MCDNIGRIKAELEGLGYATSVFDSPHGRVVSFRYTIETGSRKGKKVWVGVSFQGSEGYPEYPPHWLHASPPIDDGQGGVVETYRDAQQREWVAMSRPPGDIWDRLPTKHMRVYINEHLRRVWNNV